MESIDFEDSEVFVARLLHQLGIGVRLVDEALTNNALKIH